MSRGTTEQGVYMSNQESLRNTDGLNRDTEDHMQLMGNQTNLNSSDQTEYKMYDIENDIDPETNCHNNLEINCEDYLEQFNTSVDIQ